MINNNILIIVILIVLTKYENDLFWQYYKRKQTEHNPNCPQIPDHPYRILIFGGSGSEKINGLLNLLHHQQDIAKIYLHAKDLYESKY